MTSLKSDFFSRLSSLSDDSDDTDDDVRFRRIRIIRIHLASFIQLQKTRKRSPVCLSVNIYVHPRLQSPDSGITFLVSDVVVLGDKRQYQSQSSEKISIRILQPDFL